jgi:hypothetical protein
MEQLPQTINAYADEKSFELAQRIAKALASSDLVPQTYKGKVENVMIALEMANRVKASPMAVMQNLNIIQGKPSWSSTFIISVINSCGKFTPLRFEMTGSGDSLSCYAHAKDSEGNVCKSPTVTMAMAINEGWSTKAGSKWKTMPELMIQYRSAAFFGRLYCPEILMGMQSEDEVIDVSTPSDIVLNEKQFARVMGAATKGRRSEVEQVLNAMPNLNKDQKNQIETAMLVFPE